MYCGLLGRKLSHSYSPKIHAMLGSYRYDLFEKEPDELASFLKNGDFHGLNVTIPYKKSVIAYCNRLTPAAQALGAVNTLIRQPDGTLLGHNTDYSGFLSTVKRSGISVHGKKVLVLGSGGASATVCAVLQQLGANVVVISRNGENNYENLQKHNDCAVLVNATPVGMYPNQGIAPVSLSFFPKLEYVFDLIYNPARTALMLDAEARGIPAENGLWMLVAQAKESAEYFTGSKISNTVIDAIHGQLLRQMKNIILVGMPSCGKSTVGRLLAQQIGLEFADTDRLVEQMAGCTIPEIFQQKGEDGFRQLETNAIKALGGSSGLVIATGGGCVTREQNYPLLHQNGTIIWLRRNTEQLERTGRPLSQGSDLSQMYRIRCPLYERFSDITVDNNGRPEDCVQTIIHTLCKGKTS